MSAITGANSYEFLAKRYNKRCVIAGFEPLDILRAILMLIRQKGPNVEIEYRRIVDRSGNVLAKRAIKNVFKIDRSVWRGIGPIRASGLKIRKHFVGFDAEKKFSLKLSGSKENRDCICGDILKGIKTPLDCKLFSGVCAPENPVGACMVSSEGTCAAYYKYRAKG